MKRIDAMPKMSRMKMMAAMAAAMLPSRSRIETIGSYLPTRGWRGRPPRRSSKHMADVRATKKRQRKREFYRSLRVRHAG